MIEPLLMAVVWLTAILIIVPWFFILILPWFFSTAAFAMVPPGVLLVLWRWALRQKAVGEASSRLFEMPRREPFRIFIQDAPDLQNSRESVEAILVEHQRRISEKIVLHVLHENSSLGT